MRLYRQPLMISVKVYGSSISHAAHRAKWNIGQTSKVNTSKEYYQLKMKRRF